MHGSDYGLEQPFNWVGSPIQSNPTSGFRYIPLWSLTNNLLRTVSLLHTESFPALRAGWILSHLRVQFSGRGSLTPEAAVTSSPNAASRLDAARTHLPPVSVPSGRHRFPAHWEI